MSYDSEVGMESLGALLPHYQMTQREQRRVDERRAGRLADKWETTDV